jgi:hypothetical protein
VTPHIMHTCHVFIVGDCAVSRVSFPCLSRSRPVHFDRNATASRGLKLPRLSVIFCVPSSQFVRGWTGGWRGTAALFDLMILTGPL